MTYTIAYWMGSHVFRVLLFLNENGPTQNCNRFLLHIKLFLTTVFLQSVNQSIKYLACHEKNWHEASLVYNTRRTKRKNKAKITDEQSRVREDSPEGFLEKVCFESWV